MKFSVLLVDADIENPVDHLVLGISRELRSEISSFLPEIDSSKCIGCLKCVLSCPEHALIGLKGSVPKLMEELCNGCGVCKLVCPRGAIVEKQRMVARVWVGEKNGINYIACELLPGVKQAHAVTEIFLKSIEEQLRSYNFAIIDTIPGAGSSVYSCIKRSNVVIAVTEPTPLGAHDLDLLLQLCERIDRKVITVLNRADLPGSGKDYVLATVDKFKHIVIGYVEIPYLSEVVKYYSKSDVLTLLEKLQPFKQPLEKLAELLIEISRKV